jgi:hypothetical protein
MIKNPVINEKLTVQTMGGFVTRLKDYLLNGEASALERYVQLKAMEKIIKQVVEDSDVRSTVLNEAEKEGKDFNYKGANIKIANTGKYDYSACNDPSWLHYSESEEKFKELRKSREAFLKTLKDTFSEISADGEITEICPPVNLAKPTVVVTIKK